jgi:hypothetical protein
VLVSAAPTQAFGKTTGSTQYYSNWEAAQESVLLASFSVSQKIAYLQEVHFFPPPNPPPPLSSLFPSLSIRIFFIHILGPPTSQRCDHTYIVRTRWGDRKFTPPFGHQLRILSSFQPGATVPTYFTKSYLLYSLQSPSWPLSNPTLCTRPLNSKGTSHQCSIQNFRHQNRNMAPNGQGCK